MCKHCDCSLVCTLAFTQGVMVRRAFRAKTGAVASGQSLSIHGMCHPASQPHPRAALQSARRSSASSRLCLRQKYSHRQGVSQRLAN